MLFLMASKKANRAEASFMGISNLDLQKNDGKWSLSSLRIIPQEEGFEMMSPVVPHI